MTVTGLAGLWGKLRQTRGEVARFGVVGAVGWLVDTAVFNLCLRVLGLPTVRSGVIANAVAIGSNYLGNRYWTYQQSDKSRRGREAALFVLFSGAGMVIQNGVLAVSHYGFGYVSAWADTVAKNIVGLGVATVFRFWAYRTWVFRPAPPEVSGMDAERASARSGAA